MKPAVEWISNPRRPNELFPSSLATRSSGSRMRSRVDPRTNSPGWSTNGVSSSTSTSSVRSSCSSRTSMYGYRLLWKTRKNRSTRTSTLDGWRRESSYGSISIRPSSRSLAIVRSERTTARFYEAGPGREAERLLVFHTLPTRYVLQPVDPNARSKLRRLEARRRRHKHRLIAAGALLALISAGVIGGVIATHVNKHNPVRAAARATPKPQAQGLQPRPLP